MRGVLTRLMRVLIKLKSLRTQPYQMEYHYHLQGFIYGLLRNSKFEQVHDKEGYKFFCFSNIFPANDLAKDDTRTLLISSPDNGFIDYLHGVLQKPRNEHVLIGKMKFKIESVEEFVVSPPESRPISVITGTPIIIRMARETMQKNGIEAKGIGSHFTHVPAFYLPLQCSRSTRYQLVVQ